MIVIIFGNILKINQKNYRSRGSKSQTEIRPEAKIKLVNKNTNTNNKIL